MKTIASTELKAESLALLEGAGPEGVVIVSNGKPVARLVAIADDDKPKTGAFLIGALKGQVGIKGDIFSTGIKWDAESGYSYHPVRDQRNTDDEGEDRA
ncbi:MAG TPA: type II toxin-antitoxin system prevent-host-death family antitoxin [Tepidisphaeraceae bacterium]|jgi:prevent-host-death family protein